MLDRTLTRRERRLIATCDASDLLALLANQEGALTVLLYLAEWLRQGGVAQANDRLMAFNRSLENAETLCEQVSNTLHSWLQNMHVYASFVSVGIFARHGILHETRTMLYDRANPLPVDESQLQDVLDTVFNGSKDLEWLASISLRHWLSFFTRLSPDAVQRHRTRVLLREECTYALEMLAIRLSAEDLAPDLIRLDKRLLDIDSPFVSLERELARLIAAWRETPDSLPDADTLAHAGVLIDQSRQQLHHLNSRAIASGSSLSTAHLLERLTQSLDRLESLLSVLTAETAETEARYWLALVNQLIESGLQKRNIRHLWKRSAFLLSQSITQHKSAHGEHYIARDWHGFGKLFASAAGAGIIIALMAGLKIYLSTLHLSLNAYTLLSSLDYGIGFVLIYLCHCTVATKQPAMTAAHMAEAVEKSSHGRAAARKIAQLLIDVNRSQTAAVLGNILLAMTVASLICGFYAHQQASPLLSAYTADKQLHALALPSALFYAAIAAVWLFCSGIIAGYYDNRAQYLQLRERLRVNPLLRRFMGQKLRARFADFMHDHLGALASNFIFGLLLGVTPWIGKVLELPLDIRHIAFSSANLAYAASSQPIGFWGFLHGLLAVIAIGLVNLWVSFYLALRIALRARETRFPALGQFFTVLWEEIRRNPKALFLPAQRKTP
ncbi:MAG: recombinase [Cardiobacteriaceae bacterium]|nr:recombinase [Cardiobacteriaceae bacterium]